LEVEPRALKRSSLYRRFPMFPPIKHGWSKPSTILFASEFPANENVFAFALAQARESCADLIIFHVYEDSGLAAGTSSETRPSAYAEARAARRRFEHLAQRARDLGIQCRVVVRPGSAVDEILSFLEGRKIDRVVMGAHTPGPIGKLLVGSVAEAVLRNARVPVNTVGPFVVENSYRNFARCTILCSVSTHESASLVVAFAAELADRHDARLILQQAIPPQECVEVLTNRSTAQIEADLLALIPLKLRNKVNVQTIVSIGDPTEELLYQGRVQQANLIVLGAQGASHFAAVTRAGLVYKVLAYARCPVITLSPLVLAASGADQGIPRHDTVNYMAGVI
jgi:nucleotide-binding universal stress UspA family protein